MLGLENSAPGHKGESGEKHGINGQSKPTSAFGVAKFRFQDPEQFESMGLPFPKLDKNTKEPLGVMIVKITPELLEKMTKNIKSYEAYATNAVKNKTPKTSLIKKSEQHFSKTVLKNIKNKIGFLEDDRHEPYRPINLRAAGTNELKEIQTVINCSKTDPKTLPEKVQPPALPGDKLPPGNLRG